MKQRTAFSTTSKTLGNGNIDAYKADTTDEQAEKDAREIMLEDALQNIDKMDPSCSIFQKARAESSKVKRSREELRQLRV